MTFNVLIIILDLSQLKKTKQRPVCCKQTPQKKAALRSLTVFDATFYLYARDRRTYVFILFSFRCVVLFECGGKRHGQTTRSLPNQRPAMWSNALDICVNICSSIWSC